MRGTRKVRTFQRDKMRREAESEDLQVAQPDQAGEMGKMPIEKVLLARLAHLIFI
jgi:hypothetical protein